MGFVVGALGSVALGTMGAGMAGGVGAGAAGAGTAGVGGGAAVAGSGGALAQSPLGNNFIVNTAKSVGQTLHGLSQLPVHQRAPLPAMGNDEAADVSAQDNGAAIEMIQAGAAQGQNIGKKTVPSFKQNFAEGMLSDNPVLTYDDENNIDWSDTLGKAAGRYVRSKVEKHVNAKPEDVIKFARKFTSVNQ